jgi:hypothetical protein
LKYNKKYVPVFAAIVLLTLSLSAYAYAHWEELLYFNADIHTGTMEAAFGFVSPTTDGNDWTITDWDPDTYLVADIITGPPLVLPWREITDKDIAEAYIVMSQDGKTATMHIENAYPAFLAGFDALIYNVGTVPWRLWKGEIVGVGTFQSNFEWIPLNLDGDADIEAYLQIDTLAFGYQIDPGQWIDMSWQIYFTNDVLEGECFDIEIKLWYLNWNEWIEFTPTYGPPMGPGDLTPPL